MGFSASPYFWWYEAKPLGVIDDAPELSWQLNGQEIRADAYGGQPIDWILLGATARIDMVFSEFNNEAVQDILNAPTGRFGQIMDPAGSGGIGCAYAVNGAGVLLGTAIGNCYHWNWWTAYGAIMSPESQVLISLGSRLQNVPIRFELLPYVRTQQGNVHRNFDWDVDTAPDTTTPPTVGTLPPNWYATSADATAGGIRSIPGFLAGA